MANKDDILLNITGELDSKKLTQEINKTTKDLADKLSDTLSGTLSTFNNTLRNTISSLSKEKIKIEVEFDSEEGERRLREKLSPIIPKPKTSLPSGPTSDPYKTKQGIFNTNQFITKQNTNDVLNKLIEQYITKIDINLLAKKLKDMVDDGFEKEFKQKYDINEAERRLGAIPKPTSGMPEYQKKLDYSTEFDPYKTNVNVKLGKFSATQKLIQNAILKGLDRIIEIDLSNLNTYKSSINEASNRAAKFNNPQISRTGDKYNPNINEAVNRASKFNVPELVRNGERYSPKSSPLLLGAASEKDIEATKKQTEAEAKLKIKTEEANRVLEEQKKKSSDAANAIFRMSGILEELNKDLSKFGDLSSKSTDKIKDLISTLLKIKPNEKGLFTDAQIKKINDVIDKTEKLSMVRKSFQEKEAKVTQAAGNFSLLGTLEEDLEKAKKSLKDFGLTESQVESTTKKAAGGISFLKEQILLLTDAVDKGQIDVAFSAIDKIGKSKPLTESRIKTLSENRGGIADPTLNENSRKSAEVANFQSKLTPAYLKLVNKELTDQRLEVAKLGVPLNVVNKQTRNYDSTLTTIEKNLEDLNREYKKWQDTLGKEGTSLDDAHKGYQKIINDLRKLEIGIEQIGTKAPEFKKAFDLEEADPRQLSYRLGILGFTLQTVGGTLSNFARTFFQSMDQLAQAAEPIERVQNALDLQRRQGEFGKDAEKALKTQEIILSRLREIGDIPGSSVEQANKTFNSLQKVNISLERRLQLTEGIAKLAAAPGGEPGSGEQVTNALLNLANKGGNVDAENFKTLRVQGGRVFAELNRSLGLNTADDLERFGVNKYLDKVAESLSKIESPAATTTDRFNRLKSRMSEFGVVLGKILGPGLDKLNETLKQLEIIVKQIGDRFDKLSPTVKNSLSTIIVLVPVVVGALGVLLTTIAAVGFAFSGLRQVKELGPILKGVFNVGNSKNLTNATSKTVEVTKQGPLIGQVGKESAQLVSKEITVVTKAISPLKSSLLNLSKIFTSVFSIAIKPIQLVASALLGIKNAFTLARASGGGFFTFLKSLFSSLTGGVGLFKLLGGGLTGIAGGFAKILGFTNPIGIAINAILSVFTALWDNFNGIRDRLGLVFSEFLKSLSKLTSALGLGPGGLYTMFKLLMDVLNGLFGFIGEIVIELLNTLLITLTDVTNNIANIINLVKDGQWMSALWEGIKLLFNATFGLLKNLVISVVASMIDAIASIYEYWGGGKDNFLRGLSDDLRSLNGTDKASIERYKNEKAVTDEKEKQLEITENLKKEEEERNLRIEELDSRLKEVSEKIKEDYIKLQFDQALEKTNLFNDLLKENTDLQIESFKQLIEGTSDIDKVTSSYNVTLSILNENQKRLISNQSTSSLLKGLSDFRTAVSSSQEGFKEIYQLANEGKAGFKELVNSINAVSNSTSLDGFNNALNNLQNISNQVGGSVSLILRNTIEKSRSIIDDNGRQTQNLIKEYRKLIKEISIAQNDRKLNIEKESANIEKERKNRADAQRDQLRSINYSSRDEYNSVRTSTSDIDSLYNEQQRKAVEDNDKLLRDRRELLFQLEDIDREFRRRLYNTTQTSTDQNEINRANELLSSKSKRIEALKEEYSTEAQQYRKVSDQIDELVKNYNELQEANKDLFSQRNRSLLYSYNQGIIESFNLLNQGLEKFVTKLSETTARIFRIFSPSGSGSKTLAYGTLLEDIQKIKDSTSALPGLSAFTDDLDKLQERLKSGEPINKILADFLNLLVKLNTIDFAKNTSDSFNELNLSIERFNFQYRKFKDDQGNEKEQDEISLKNKDNFNISKIFGSLSTRSNEDIINEVGSIKDNAFSKESRRILQESLSGKGTQEELILNAISNIAAQNENDAKQLLEIIFRTDSKEGGSIRAKIFLDALKVYNNLDKQKKAEIDELLKVRVEVIDNIISQEKNRIDKQSAIFERELDLVNEKLQNANGKERKELLDQQKDIKGRLIVYNYQKLDIEEAYNIQKAIAQNKGNQEEIDRIIKQGEKVREQYRIERDKQLKEAGITINKDNTISGNNGVIKENDGSDTSLNPTVVDNIGTDGSDRSAELTNTTIPSGSDPTTATDRIQNSANIIRDTLDGVSNAAREAGDSILSMYDRLASGEGIINTFKDLIGGASFKLEDLGQAFMNVAEFAIAAFGQALGQAITDTLLNGGNFLKNLKQFFGDMLITMGQQLISLGAMATAIGLLALIPFFSYLDPDHKALVFGPIAIATGIAAVLAGKALGGGQQSAATSNTNATNSANSSAGNSNQVEYDPEKDPKMIYQKALQQQVLIEVRTDDTNLVKKFIRTMNRDTRISTLIGNRSTGFAL